MFAWPLYYEELAELNEDQIIKIISDLIEKIKLDEPFMKLNDYFSLFDQQDQLNELARKHGLGSLAEKYLKSQVAKVMNGEFHFNLKFCLHNKSNRPFFSTSRPYLFYLNFRS
jgi:hypothetical protein